MREVEALARASGVDLDRDAVEQALAVIDGAAPSMKTSMQRDLEAGRPSELDSMIGKNADKKSCAAVVIPVLKLFFANA